VRAWLSRWWGLLVAGVAALLYLATRQRSDAQRRADASEAQLEVERNERHAMERDAGLRATERARHELAVAALVKEDKRRDKDRAKLQAKVDEVAKGGPAGADVLAELLADNTGSE